MDSEYYNNLLREQATQQEERKEELRKNPLAAYSTTQLKAELRRRKGGK